MGLGSAEVTWTRHQRHTVFSLARSPCSARRPPTEALATTALPCLHGHRVQTAGGWSHGVQPSGWHLPHGHVHVGPSVSSRDLIARVLTAELCSLSGWTELSLRLFGCLGCSQGSPLELALAERGPGPGAEPLCHSCEHCLVHMPPASGGPGAAGSGGPRSPLLSALLPGGPA